MTLPDLPLPFTDPVLIFGMVMLIVLVAPLLFERLRVPGIVGLILAGAIVGPSALGLLARDGDLRAHAVVAAVGHEEAAFRIDRAVVQPVLRTARLYLDQKLELALLGIEAVQAALQSGDDAGLVGSADHHLYALESATGATVWSQEPRRLASETHTSRPVRRTDSSSRSYSNGTSERASITCCLFSDCC